MSKITSSRPLPSRKMKVLLVEDSVLLREVIIDTLSSCSGLSFDGVAGTQADAIALLQQHAFDLLIVDIELAQGNGLEVIKFTKLATYLFPQPLCIVLTNHANAQYRLLARNIGVEYFFDKSMDFDLAIDTIETETGKFMTLH